MNASSQTPVSPHQAPLSEATRARSNGIAVQALLDRTGLPAPTVVPQADVVHVVLADIDDMAPWLAELDGWVGVSAEQGGVRTWTLHTGLEATRHRGAVQVWVHALAVPGQDVLPVLRDATGVAA